ncbi:MAG: cyclase family protein [Methylococcales bacterium]
MKHYLPFLFFALTACSQSPHIDPFSEKTAWIDLSHSFDDKTLYWPNNAKGFEHTTDSAGVTPPGYYYSSFSLCAPEHGGTHLDAPIHFAEHMLTVDQLPLASLTGRGVLIDVSEKALADKDYQVGIADFEAWEKANGPLPLNAIILIRTGYEQFYPDRERYFGTAKTGNAAIPELHFPGVAPEAALWLVQTREIKALGLDTPSLDYGQSKDFKTHRVLLGQNKPGFENLTHLKRLPAKGFYVVALPMKIANGSGAPLRVIATVLP